MRAIVTACAALAALSLTGCDINTGPPKAQADCHCTNLPGAAPPATGGDTNYEPRPAHHHRHHHGYAEYGGSAHSYSWRREYSEVSVATYDYRSDSHSYTLGASDAAYSGGGGERHGDRVDDRGGATAGEPVYRERDDRHRRLSPWHGYDADCPDRDRHN